MDKTLAKPFLGTWLLDPKQNRYEFGQAPIAALYEISAQKDQFKIYMEWINVEKKVFQHQYLIKPDGKEYSTDPQHSNIAVLKPNLFETTNKFQNMVIGQTFREVSADGKQMMMLQIGADQTGKPYKNVSVYVKQDQASA